MRWANCRMQAEAVVEAVAAAEEVAIADSERAKAFAAAAVAGCY